MKSHATKSKVRDEKRKMKTFQLSTRIWLAFKYIQFIIFISFCQRRVKICDKNAHTMRNLYAIAICTLYILYVHKHRAHWIRLVWVFKVDDAKHMYIVQCTLYATPSVHIDDDSTMKSCIRRQQQLIDNELHSNNQINPIHSCSLNRHYYYIFALAILYEQKKNGNEMKTTTTT